MTSRNLMVLLLGTAALMFAGALHAQWVYNVTDHLSQGQNPGGLNTESDFSTTGWTEIQPGGNSSNIWSPVTPLPFAFEFYGQPVTDFMASQNGVVTFDTAATSLPGANENLPSSQLPDMSIAAFWDEFTSSPPTGTTDDIYVKTFGTAPNRQFWIKYYSFEISTRSYSYWALALEETTNKVYVVEYSYFFGSSNGMTVGVQENTSNAAQFGNNTLQYSTSTSSSITNNGWYEFEPELLDGTIITGGSFAGNARVGGTDIPVSDFEISAYSNAQDISEITLTYTGSVVSADVMNIKLWDDANNNGVVDSGESQLGSTVGSLTSGQATFTGSPLLSIPVSTSTNVLVTCDVASGAPGKESISFEVSGASDVVTSPGPDSSQYPVLGGGVETIEYFSNLPFFTDFSGGVEAGNQSLAFEAGTYPTGSGEGSTPGSGTTNSDGSMSFTSGAGPTGSIGGEQLVSEYASSSAATALDSRFDLSAYDASTEDVYLTFGWYEEDWPAPTGDDFNYVFISDDSGQTWFTAVYDFDEDLNSPNWTHGQVHLSDAFLNASRTFTSDIIIRIQTGGTSSAQSTIIDYVEVREIYPGATVSAEAPSNTDISGDPAYGRFGIALKDDLVVQVFTLEPELDDQDVSEITVTNGGTMSDGDITSVKLWLDVNYDGRIDSGDVLLGNETYSSGEAMFSFSPIPINMGTTRDFVVTYSFTPSASGTIGCNIADAGDLVISPDQAYAYDTFPVGEDMGDAATPTATLPYLEDFEAPPGGNIAGVRDPGVYPTAGSPGGPIGDTSTSNAAELGWWSQFNGINPNDGSNGMGTFEFGYGDAAAAMDFLFDLSAYSATSDDLLFRFAWLNNGLDEGMANLDHVFISNDGGETWITSLLELDPELQEDQWRTSFTSVSEALLDAGQDYTDDMVIRVQFASDTQYAMVDDVELFVLQPTAPTFNDPQATGGGVAGAGFPAMMYFKFNAGSGTTALNEAVPGVGDPNPAFLGSPTWNTSDPVVGNASVEFGDSSTTTYNTYGKIYTGWQTSLTASQSFTIEAWVRVQYSFGYLCGDSSAGNFRIYNQSGRLSIRGGGFSNHDMNGTVNSGNWTHVAVVYDAAANETRWYVNGAHDSTMTGQTANASATSTSGFAIGSNSTTGATTFSWAGDVDDFRMWDTARSAQDVQSAYQSELDNYPTMSFQGNNPNYTATIEQGGTLDFSVSANDINTGDSLTFTVSEIGGSLTADEAGFDQEFVSGVYNDPNPNQPAPHSIALTGVADQLGTIELEFEAEDATGLSGNVTVDITIVQAADPLVRAVPLELHPMNAYGFGVPSVPEMTTIQGYGLTGDLTITAPPQFEVSQTASVGYGSSVTLTPVSGDVQRTDIYVRYNPSVSGPHEGDVVATGPGVQIDAKIAVEGFILPQIPPVIQRPTSAGDGDELLTLAPEEPKADESGYPLNTWWEDLRIESVYLVSELTQAGLSGGAPITQVEFKVSEQPGMDLNNVRIRMGHSGSDTVSDLSTSGLDRVFGPANLSADEFTVGEWYAFKFHTPFIWNGVDNVLVDFSMDGTAFEGPGGIYMRQVGEDRSQTGYADSTSSYPFNTIENQTGLDEVPSIRISQGLMIDGSTPDYTAVGVVGDPLNLEFNATNANVQQTVTFQVTETGGTLNASQIGFNQQFSGGVYADPNPGRAPRTLTLDGTAATTGTLDLEVSVNNGTFDAIINVAIEIVDPPALSVEGTPFPTFVAPTSGGPSDEQSFTISGASLLSDVTISVPDEFGISDTSGSGYGSSVTLPASGGSLAATSLYVIYDPSGSSNAAAGDMVIATDRISSIQELVFGVVGDDPVMTTLDTPIPTLFAPAIGTPGDPYDFTVLVSNPIGPVSVTAPSEFEVSLSEDGGFGNSVAVAPPQGGTSQLTMVVFVRYNPAGPSDSAAGDIEIAASSAAPLAVAVQGSIGDGPSSSTGDSSGDDGGGCSTGTTEYSTWMLLISALAALMLATRLRHARE